MQVPAGSKTVARLLLVALFASFPSVAPAADEIADRGAIENTIAALNQFPPSTTLFTADADAVSELGRLPNVRPVSFRIPAPSGDPAALIPVHPTVTISHDPWGEATIDIPAGLGLGKLAMGVEVLNPHIASGAIRFLTPDIALADGTWTYRNGETPETAPLLFVMKREGGVWKIASLRLLAH